MESGLPPSANSEIVLEASLAGGRSHGAAIVESRFQILVLAGELRFSLRNPSARYSVVSVTYGSADLRSDPLILSGPPTSEIVVTLRSVTATAPTTGATVSGTLSGALSELATPRRIVLCAYERSACDEVVASNTGSFEFRGVQSGTYRIRVVGTLYAIPPSMVEVRERDVVGVAVRVLHSVAVRVTVAVDDGSPLPDWPQMKLSSSGPSGPLEASIPPAGTLEYRFGEGEQFLLMKNLPDGYDVKSMTYDGKDVLQFPLTIARDDAPSTLRITLFRNH